MRVCTLTSQFWARHHLVSANTFSDGALTPEIANSFSSWASLDVSDIEQLEYSSLHLPTDFILTLSLNLITLLHESKDKQRNLGK